AETFPTGNASTCCFCVGVVTVMVWKPACWSRVSFCGEAAVVVPVLAHPVTKVKVATAQRTLVRVNSFFMCFVSPYSLCGRWSWEIFPRWFSINRLGGVCADYRTLGLCPLFLIVIVLVL